MEMVLVDEKGNKMRASMLTKIFLKFGIKVKLNETLLITNTVLADLKLNQRILGCPHKISFNLSTQMVLVDDFIGEPFTFSFESFADVNANKFDQHQTVSLLTRRPLLLLEIKVLMTNRSIKVTLFGDYAKQMDTYITQYPDAYNVVIVLQLGKFTYFKSEPGVSNNYYVSKLFIDKDIPAINGFKKRIEQGSALSSSSQRSISSSSVFTIKSVVILATIVHIPPVQEWHYFGCPRCSKSLTNKETPSDTDDLYECPNEGCKGTELLPVSKFRIHIRVQDTSGTVSLTLWDRNAYKILNVTAEKLVEENNGGFDVPSIFNTLLQKKYTFKIDVKEYNIVKNAMNFNITKFSEDPIIPEISEQNQLSSGDCQSEDTVINKEILSFTGENSITPISNDDKNRPSSPPSNLKRKLGDIYDVDDPPVANSSTKSNEKHVLRNNSGDNKNLLIPKKEK
ncbi:uncharacterized protein LOC143578900 [Bidens hawaiensis]|uniref:uncharacterized protein LOC143578900 n=1 Tax=Bidens hawaiensis TaxID=980011 RepID=UPI00404AF1C2